MTCQAATVAELRSTIEGAYILDEWDSGGKVFHPPQVEGRVVFVNGVIVVILEDARQESKKTYSASFGSYHLSPDSFGYKFQSRAVATQTPDKVTLSRAIPWQGLREFTVKQDGDVVRLQYEGKAEFAFTAERLTYSEGGKILRVYHRAKDLNQ